MSSPNRRRRPAKRGVDLAGAYAKLGSGSRIGGTSHYKDPEVLRRVPVPGSGELRLESLSPYGGGDIIVRWVATYVDGAGAHCTTERYLQVPHHGFDVLEQPDAARMIEEDCRALIEKIKRARAHA